MKKENRKKKTSSAAITAKRATKRKRVKRAPAKRPPALNVALKQRRISEVMSLLPLTIGKDQSLAQAHAIMREHKIRHLPVLDGGAVFGIVSERDLHLVETFRDVDPTQVTVEEAASRDPFMVRYDATVGEVARRMADKKLGAALVVDDDERVIGVFTTIDALRAILS
ncbi:MAG: CBS domain-containing protein [Deltaproteobacteria bacterium]|nr:CBS domain-containing protein [Deltaproteobacteria bacterium]